MPNTGVPCSNAAKTRNLLKFARVPQTNETISAGSKPVDMCLNCEDIARQSCAMVTRWGFFGEIFASCIFSEWRVARFRAASYTKATRCVEVWQTSNLRRLRLGEEIKKIERKKIEEITGQKYNVHICYARRP